MFEQGGDAQVVEMAGETVESMQDIDLTRKDLTEEALLDETKAKLLSLFAKMATVRQGYLTVLHEPDGGGTPKTFANVSDVR